MQSGLAPPALLDFVVGKTTFIPRGMGSQDADIAALHDSKWHAIIAQTDSMSFVRMPLFSNTPFGPNIPDRGEANS